MLYAQVIGQEVGKVFETRVEAENHYGTEENIFPVLYPTEWLEFEVKVRIQGNTYICLDVKKEKWARCYIMGIDVSYPQA